MPYYSWRFLDFFGSIGGLLAFRFPVNNDGCVVGIFSHATVSDIGDGPHGKPDHVAGASSSPLDQTFLRITGPDTKPDLGDHIDFQFGKRDGDLVQMTGAAIG